MLPHYGLLQVLRVWAHVQGTIRLAGISEGRYPFSRLEDRCNHSLLNHLVECVLYLLPVLNGGLPQGMLDRGNTEVSPDGIGPRHIAYSIGVWQGLLQGNYVLDHRGGGRGSHLGWLYLEGRFWLDVVGRGIVVFKGW